jgi:hypothetical protein
MSYSPLINIGWEKQPVGYFRLVFGNLISLFLSVGKFFQRIFCAYFRSESLIVIQIS